jgi:hypothetical protein
MKTLNELELKSFLESLSLAEEEQIKLNYVCQFLAQTKKPRKNVNGEGIAVFSNINLILMKKKYSSYFEIFRLPLAEVDEIRARRLMGFGIRTVWMRTSGEHAAECIITKFQNKDFDQAKEEIENLITAVKEAIKA